MVLLFSSLTDAALHRPIRNKPTKFKALNGTNIMFKRKNCSFRFGSIPFFWGPPDRHHSILGLILGSPLFQETATYTQFAFHFPFDFPFIYSLGRPLLHARKLSHKSMYLYILLAINPIYIHLHIPIATFIGPTEPLSNLISPLQRKPFSETPDPKP